MTNRQKDQYRLNRAIPAPFFKKFRVVFSNRATQGNNQMPQVTTAAAISARIIRNITCIFPTSNSRYAL